MLLRIILCCFLAAIACNLQAVKPLFESKDNTSLVINIPDDGSEEEAGSNTLIILCEADDKGRTVSPDDKTLAQASTMQVVKELNRKLLEQIASRSDQEDDDRQSRSEAGSDTDNIFFMPFPKKKENKAASNKVLLKQATIPQLVRKLKSIAQQISSPDQQETDQKVKGSMAYLWLESLINKYKYFFLRLLAAGAWATVMYDSSGWVTVESTAKMVGLINLAAGWLSVFLYEGCHRYHCYVLQKKTD